MDTGRKQDDEFEPQPENYYCKRMGVERSLKYLKGVVYWHLSSICKECEYENKCKEKEDKK